MKETTVPALLPPPLWAQHILCAQTFIDFIMWSYIYVGFIGFMLPEDTWLEYAQSGLITGDAVAGFKHKVA